MDLRQELINYIVENNEVKREIDFGSYREGQSISRCYLINYYFNDMIIKNKKWTNKYVISNIAMNMTEIHLNDIEKGFYLNSDLNLIMPKTYKENSRNNIMDNVIHNSYKDLKPFLDKFKLINKLENKLNNINKSVKKLKI